MAMNFNALIRHAHSVKMADFYGLNRRLVMPGPQGMVLQASTLSRSTAGPVARRRSTHGGAATPSAPASMRLCGRSANRNRSAEASPALSLCGRKCEISPEVTAQSAKFPVCCPPKVRKRGENG
jgi:hypothetical protein